MTRKMMTIAVAAFVALAASAEPEVTDVVAKQRYPWNGLVDITCKVTGVSAGTEGRFTVATVTPDSGNVHKVSQFWVVKDGTNSTDRMVCANGSYHLVWNARIDLGTGLHSNIVVRVNIKIPNKVQLWAGGPYWADTNIGAVEPYEYGYYFWWGDTIGYRRENNAWVANDGSTSSFSFDPGNTPTYGKSNSTLRSEGWITADGVLALEHDAARAHWGGKWRMPTDQELSALNSNCDWTWTTMNGVNGYVVRGRGDYATASIFLPAAGDGNGTSLNFAGSYGYYWSSDPRSDDRDDSWYLYFYSGYHYPNSLYRPIGQSVRPVQGFTE